MSGRVSLVRAITAVLLAVLPVSTAWAAHRLTVMVAEPPRTMDPADQSATDTSSILSPFYETLVSERADGAIVPGLATRWYTDPDRRVWHFIVRPKVVFHDGTPCDARAVAASLNRILDPGNGLVAGTLFRAIVRSARVEHDAHGQQSIAVTLTHPFMDFLHVLALVQYSVVSPKAVADGTLGRHADGTGPFTFEAWRAGEQVDARRNPSYWGERPSIELLRWMWSPEPSVANMALRTGDVDVVTPLAPLFAREAEAQKAGIVKVLRRPGSAMFWVALNTRLAPLEDPRVRRALGLAIDRDALVAGLLNGFGVPACHATTPGIPGWEPCGALAQAHRTRARALLREAGYGDGLTVSIAVQEPEEPIAEALQAMWRKVGVDLAIRREEAGIWMQSAFASPLDKAKAGLNMVLTSWSTLFISDYELRPLYSSVNAAPNGANLGFLTDKRIDAAIDAAAAAETPEQQASLNRLVEDKLDDAAALLPLYVRDTVAGVRRNVTGVGLLPNGEIRVAFARKALPATEGRQ